MTRDLLFSVKQGEFAFYLVFDIANSDGSPANLQGAAVTLKTWQIGATVDSINSACAIRDTVNGVATYLVKQGDFPVAGVYFLEVLVQQGGTNLLMKSKTYTFAVEATAPQ